MSKIYGHVFLVTISMAVPAYAQDGVDIEEEVVVSESEVEEVVLDPNVPQSNRLGNRGGTTESISCG